LLLRTRFAIIGNRVRISLWEVWATERAFIMPYVRKVTLAVACTVRLACVLSEILSTASFLVYPARSTWPAVNLRCKDDLTGSEQQPVFENG
jgi:hypothetical protein